MRHVRLRIPLIALLAALAATATVLLVTGAFSGSSGPTVHGLSAAVHRAGGRRGALRPIAVLREKRATKEKDEHGGEAERETVKGPATEQVENRAYPRSYVETKRALAARKAFAAIPGGVSSTNHSGATTRAALTGASIPSHWRELGPITPDVPATVNAPFGGTTTSGRITALAVDPNCGSPQHACRVWIAAAGGGIWRTPDALSPSPTWTALGTGVTTGAFGSLVVDPNDPTGNTLYAGSGEANGSSDSEVGVGLFKTTDGGDHWSLVPGSAAVAHDRSVASIAIDPTDPGHIYMGTALARHGSSSVNGGRRTPPGAPTLGLYESTNGGTSFSLAFSRPGSSEDPAGGADWFQGGVNKILLDLHDPDTVYAAIIGDGLWRRSQSIDGNGSFHQVFATRVPANLYGDRTEFDLAVAGGKTADLPRRFQRRRQR